MKEGRKETLTEVYYGIFLTFPVVIFSSFRAGGVIVDTSLPTELG